MSFSLNDKFSIDATTASSRLEGNLELKNILTFRDEENVVSLNSFTVPNNIGFTNTQITGVGYNYSQTPLSITTQGSNQLLYQISNGGAFTSNVVVWIGSNQTTTLSVGGGSNTAYLFRYDAVQTSNFTVYGPDLIATGSLIPRLLTSNIFISANFFRRENSYFQLDGGTFTDLEVAGSNYILSGYYRQDSGNVHLKIGGSSNGPWTIASSNVLPLTNFQFNPFVIGIRENGEVAWGKCIVGILNTDGGTLSSKVLWGAGNKVYFCSYIRTQNQPVSVVTRVGEGSFVTERSVPGSSLSDSRIMVLLLIEGIGGGLERVGHILLYGVSGESFEWSRSGGDDGVLYLRNNSSAGYRVYNSDNSFINMFGITNVLIRFSNLLKVRWYAPVVSLNSSLGRATQRYNQNYTLVHTVNGGEGDVLVYNADKSVYSTIYGVAGYNTVTANIIYDDLGNVHNLLFNRYVNGGNVFSLGEGPGESFLNLFYNATNISQQYTNPYLDDSGSGLVAGSVNAGLYYRNNSAPFKVLRIGDGIDKIIMDSVFLEVTGSITLDSSTAYKVFVANAVSSAPHYLTFTQGASSNEQMYNSTGLSYIPSSGNLGIGTAIPTTSLDVRGVAQATTFTATQTTGTAPLTVASTTVVTNLNADLLDGQHASNFMTVAQTLGGVGTYAFLNPQVLGTQVEGTTLAGSSLRYGGTYQAGTTNPNADDGLANVPNGGLLSGTWRIHGRSGVGSRTGPCLWYRIS